MHGAAASALITAETRLGLGLCLWIKVLALVRCRARAMRQNCALAEALKSCERFRHRLESEYVLDRAQERISVQERVVGKVQA